MMTDEVKLICESCGAEKFYFEPEVSGRIVFDGKKFVYDFTISLQTLGFWFCVECDEGTTDEQDNMLSEKHGGERWIKQPLE